MSVAIPGVPRPGGFTVTEVLVAVALVGVLAALALPGYGTYLARSRILEATMRLADHRAKMEQLYLDRRSYVDAGGGCGIAPSPPARDDAFELRCSATASTFVVTAAGRAGSAMADFAFAVNESAQQSTLALPASWRRTADCWTIRPDGSCL